MGASGKTFIRSLPLALTLALGAFGCTGAVDGDGSSSPGKGGSMPGTGSGPNGTGSVPGAPGTGSGSGPATPGTGSGPGSQPGGPGRQPEQPSGPSAQAACPPNAKDTVGQRMLRRLTVPELETTIRAAFNLTPAQWAGPEVPPDPASIDGFSNNVDRLTVGPEYARGMLETGRKVAQIVASEPLVSTLIPCHKVGEAGPGQASCAQTFVTTFGPKLYRRPLTAAEVARYVELHRNTGRRDFRDFVHWATFTMLQSPRVIYRSELGVPDTAAPGRFKLTPYEVASALSYTYTGGPPSPDLMMAAAGNRLNTPEQIEAAARALVFDPATQKPRPAFAQLLLRFADDYLGTSTLSNLVKDATAFPDFNGEIQAAMAEETRRFLTSVLFDEKGTPSSLLTAPYTFMDARLTKFYGLPPAGADFARVMRPQGWGVGVLAQGGLLSVESHSRLTSPTKRGYFVRTRVLCGTVPPPPDNVGDLPAPTDAETTRKRYEEIHLADAGCKGCHTMFDPIGFAFEHLDATGRYRAKEGNFDIDDSGVVTLTSAGDIPFRGAAELATALGKLPEVSDCMASFVTAYAFGLDQKNAACLVNSATQELRGGMSLVDFYIRLARSEHFRTRQN